MAAFSHETGHSVKRFHTTGGLATEGVARKCLNSIVAVSALCTDVEPAGSTLHRIKAAPVAGRILTLPPIGVPRLRGFLEHGCSDRLKAELRNGSSLGIAAGAVSKCTPSRSRALTTPGIFGRDGTWPITYVPKSKNITSFCLASLLMTFPVRAQETASARSPRRRRLLPVRPVRYVGAGEDRDVVMPGKTYLNGYAGYRAVGARRGGGGRAARRLDRRQPGGHGRLEQGFRPGHGDLRRRGQGRNHRHVLPNRHLRLVLHRPATARPISSTLTVRVADPPPKDRLDVVYTKNYTIDSPLWNDRAKSLIVGWIPHCIDEINDPNLRARRHRQLRRSRQEIARRTGKPHAAIRSPTPGCIKPSNPCASP